MKKILLSVILFFIMILGVDAATLTVSGSNVNVGGKFTINIGSVNETSEYKLVYDYSLISVESLSASITSSSSIKANGSLVFRVNDSLKLEEDKNIEISLEDKNKNDDTKTIKIVIKANNAKSTSKTTSTTTTKKQEVTTTVKKSNDASLSSISIVDNDAKVVAINPEFKPDVLEYNIKVEGKVKKIFIDARAKHDKALVTISDNVNKDLQMGENRIVITVSAEDGTNKLYTLNVIKEVLDTDATLKTLSINNHPEFVFESNKFEYNLNLNNNEKELMFSYSTNNSKAKVTINNNYDLKDGSVVRIIVEAEDGTKKQYSINIIDKKTATKKEVAADKDPLIIIILSLVAVLLITGIIIVRVKKR